MLTYLRFILLPFSLLYALVIVTRNKLYDWGIFSSFQFDLPVISVGNLAVGGSGKTPATEYLVRLLSQYKIAILSRGYGRKTKGFLLADQLATADTIGDEPLQYFHKFKNVTVAVCEDRVKGIKLLRDTHDLIILDDAFQHRSVLPGLSLLLFEFSKLRRRQWMLPAGNLREPFQGYRRADVILVTKCPDSGVEERELLVNKFNKTEHKPVYFSSIKYGSLVPVYRINLPVPVTPKVFLLTGIANSEPLLSYIKSRYEVLDQFRFPDHHVFTVAEIKQLTEAFRSAPEKEKIIITTEKDSKRLLGGAIKELLVNLPVFYLPIQMELSPEDAGLFDKTILTYVSNTTRNRTIY
ncbi:tetraacyldisaccharide 4'-kinase [Pedobacter duraquae]|uniref:Tetraacyldisaccharide 4'-kinase n=1 Tax=Pedobacter duraquae TaxID=425511 RepID=A0A4R6IIL0_9SPHI|nr:tetraacyldisaccharide 4'-kinase [Pedobacter duraquae]TDO21801.1 lipid-A-disaccharide kinase [Pedobacter duraquae]